MTKPFQLHERLAVDTVIVGDLSLCRVLLMNDANYPWLILVPRRADIREAYDLPEHEQTALWSEVTAIGEAAMQVFDGYKLNIAALGNSVPQLHVHVIVRQQDDPAWPGPVWGAVEGQAYSEDELEAQCQRLRAVLNL